MKPAGPSQIRALVAEDVKPIRLALVSALEEEGYIVTGAEDGEKALAIFDVFQPDVVLLDLRMPRLGGLATCKAIRERSTVPVIIFSAIEDQHEKIATFEAGADDYVVKGTGIDELLARISANLRWARVRRGGLGGGLVGSKESPTKREVTREILNDGRPSVLVIEDDADNRELLVFTVGEVGFRYLEAADGPTALSLLTLHKPAAIIMDMNIPLLDGYALLKAVRSNEATASIPVLVVSGMARPEDISRARSLGISDYILKPWSPSDLEIRLVRAVRGANESGALRAD